MRTRRKITHLHCNSIAEEYRKMKPCNRAEAKECLHMMSPEDRKPKVPQNGFKLVNGEEQHRRHPVTFELHSQTDRNAVEVDKHVKLCLVGATDAEPWERFWVWIVSKEANDAGFTFVGQVHSELWYTDKHDISGGDMLQFGTEHILVIEK